ncbi:putative mediator of RNA polymerase II transcription subunit 26 [Clytia hemisphaerica]|uniref:Uncharacterized protein n=1 Tax=Clytia hemisphaerica TaxID=252671 RepID=A0A7M5V2L6_9CNID
MDPSYGLPNIQNGHQLSQEQLSNLTQASRRALNQIHGLRNPSPPIYHPFPPPGNGPFLHPIFHQQLQPPPNFRPIVYGDPSFPYFVPHPHLPAQSSQHQVNQQSNARNQQQIYQYISDPAQNHRALRHQLSRKQNQPQHQSIRQQTQPSKHLNSQQNSQLPSSNHPNLNQQQASNSSRENSFNTRTQNQNPPSLPTVQRHSSSENTRDSQPLTNRAGQDLQSALRNELNTIERTLSQLQEQKDRCIQEFTVIRRLYEEGQHVRGDVSSSIATLMQERKRVSEKYKKIENNFSYFSKRKELILGLLEQNETATIPSISNLQPQPIANRKPPPLRSRHNSLSMQSSSGNSDLLTPPPTPQSPDSSGMRSPHFLLQHVEQNPKPMSEPPPLKTEPTAKEETQPSSTTVSKSRLKRTTISTCIDLTDEDAQTVSQEPSQPVVNEELSRTIDQVAEEFSQPNLAVLEARELPEISEVLSGNVTFGSAEFEKIVQNEIDKVIEPGTIEDVIVKVEQYLKEESDAHSTSSDDVRVQLYDEISDIETETQDAESQITQFTDTDIIDTQSQITETDTQITVNTESRFEETEPLPHPSPPKTQRSESNSTKENRRKSLKRLRAFEDSSDEEEHNEGDPPINDSSSSSTYDLPVLKGSVKTKKVASKYSEISKSFSPNKKSKEERTERISTFEKSFCSKKCVSREKVPSKQKKGPLAANSKQCPSKEKVLTESSTKEKKISQKCEHSHNITSKPPKQRLSPPSDTESKSSASSSRPPLKSLLHRNKTLSTNNSTPSKGSNNSSTITKTPSKKLTESYRKSQATKPTNTLAKVPDAQKFHRADQILRQRKRQQQRNRKKSTTSATVPAATSAKNISNKDKQQIDFDVYSKSKQQAIKPTLIKKSQSNMKKFDLAKEAFAPVEKKQKKILHVPKQTDKPFKAPKPLPAPKKSASVAMATAPKPVEYAQEEPATLSATSDSPSKRGEIRNFFGVFHELFGEDVAATRNDSND